MNDCKCRSELNSLWQHAKDTNKSLNNISATIDKLFEIIKHHEILLLSQEKKVLIKGKE